MIKIMLSVIVSFCFAILLNCKVSQSQTESLTLHEIVKEKLGNTTATHFNASNTYVLAQQAQEPSRTGEPVFYVVIRLKDKQIMREGSFNRGYVKWISDDTIEVLSFPGKLQGNEDVSKYVKRINILKETEIN